jgi:excisionase family DNA binding protein
MKVTDAPDSLMTLGDVARYTKLSVRSVYRMKDLYGLPVKKVGKSYRVRRQDLERWIQAQPLASGQ